MGDFAFHEVRMEGVSYEIATFDPPFCAGNRPAHYSYLYLVKRGDLYLEVNTPEPCTYEVSKGAIITVSGLIPHHFRSVNNNTLALTSLNGLSRPLGSLCRGEVSLVVSKIKNDTLTFMSAYLGVRIITADIAPQVHRRIWDTYRLIEDELINKSDHADHSVRLLSENIYLNTMRHNWFLQNEMASLPGGNFDQRILRAMMEIGKNPCEDWSVERLAKVAGMSRTAFAVTYQKHTRSTPMSSVRRARLAIAIYALDTSAKPIDEIAEMCAYASSAAFIRAFKKEYGHTPSSWRRTVRQ